MPVTVPMAVPVTVVLPQHLGGLHPVETILVALLAFGPFVALGVVVYLQRRRDDSEDGS